MQRLFLLLFVSFFRLHADTVLVLPFTNQSKSPNLDWVGESIAERLRESLASEGLLVLDREVRLEAYKRLSMRANVPITRASVIKLGEALDASRVIYGQYDMAPLQGPAAAQSKGSLQITLRIIDLKHTRPGPELQEIGALEDLAALENRLGWQSLQYLAPKTSPSEEQFKKARPAVRLDALESYIRGLMAATPEQQHRYFTQSARIDPRYSQPCFQLGRIYWEKKDYAVAVNWLTRVTKADSHFMESQFLLALCRYYTRDFAGAEKGLQLVADAVPLNEVYNNLGAVQLRLNRPAAVESFRHALEGDTSDPDYHFNLGYALWKTGQFDAAVLSFRAALERQPGDGEATAFLGRALKREGPRAGDPKLEGRERIKTNYEETAYLQLKAELQGQKE